jgi:hypothetical protein
MKTPSFVLAFTLAATASAADPPVTTRRPPEAVVGQYLHALQAGRYDEMAELMDPVALLRFRDMLLPVLLEAPSPTPGVLLLDGVPDRQAAQKLTPSAFLAALFRGLIKQTPAMAEALRSVSGDVVGSVPEGDSTLHLVCRSRVSVDDLSVIKMTVVTVNLVDGQWRIALTGEIQGMAQALRRALSKPASTSGA